MAKVFLSYSRVDADFTARLAADLKQMGIDCWLDVDQIAAGEDWTDAVWAGLKACDVMLLTISPESMESRQVANEWKYYVTTGRPIIPLLWRPAEDIHYQISALQYIDFFNGDYADAVEALRVELERITGEKKTPFGDTTLDLGSARQMADVDPAVATGRIDPELRRELEEQLHYFNDQMALEITAFKTGVTIKTRIGPGQELILSRSADEAPEILSLAAMQAGDQGVSRRHAALRLESNTLYIRDLNSTNYTYVEGQRLRANEQRALKSGDRVQLGNLLLMMNFKQT